jgi:hypothetical protein
MGDYPNTRVSVEPLASVEIDVHRIRYVGDGHVRMVLRF